MELVQHRWVNTTNLNTRGRLFGGHMLEWIDEDSSILAFDLLFNENVEVTTGGILAAKFMAPVFLGDRLKFIYKAVHFSNATFTIEVKVYSKDQARQVFFALVNFVVIDANGKPVSTGLNIRADTIYSDIDYWDAIEELRKICELPLP